MKKPTKGFLPHFGMSTLLSSKVKNLTKYTDFANVFPQKQNVLKRSVQSKSSNLSMNREKYLRYTEDHPRFQKDLAELFKPKNKNKLPKLRGKKLLLSKTLYSSKYKRISKRRSMTDLQFIQKKNHLKRIS
jgi:hypothetical protein